MTHGYTSYKRGCRCDDCLVVSRRYDKRLRLDNQRGIRRLVDPTNARNHVERLVYCGMSRRSIAIAAGYKDGTGLNVILSRKSIRRETERKILSVSLKNDKANKGWVSSTGAVRRLQALCAMGWKMKIIVDKAGVNPDTISDIRNAKVDRVTERVYEAISNVYEELHMADGGDIRSKRIAERNNWVPPLAWDDIDNPKEKPKR